MSSGRGVTQVTVVSSGDAEPELPSSVISD